MKATRSRSCQKSFTLLEVLLASALFVLAGYILALAFNNAQQSLLNWENQNESERAVEWALSRIDWAEMERDTLQRGGEINTAEGLRINWTASFAPTSLLDVFHLDIYYQVTRRGRPVSEGVQSRLIRQTSWYESATVRERLVENKQRYFEQKRREELRQ